MSQEAKWKIMSNNLNLYHTLTLVCVCVWQTFGGLVWILVASTHVQPVNPLGWVMFVSVFCFIMTFLWLMIFAYGAHHNKGIWATVVSMSTNTLLFIIIIIITFQGYFKRNYLLVNTVNINQHEAEHWRNGFYFYEVLFHMKLMTIRIELDHQTIRNHEEHHLPLNTIKPIRNHCDVFWCF